MRAALVDARDALEGASLPALQRVRDALERRHTGPVTRMRARTRARAEALPHWPQTPTKDGRRAALTSAARRAGG
jgi:hypothetical protein